MRRPNPQIEQQTSIALLTATGMKPLATVERLANQHPLQRIRQYVAHWYMNRACNGGEFKDTPGIVLWWLDHTDLAAIPEIHPEFWQTPLYLNHRTPAEKRAARRARRALAGVPAPSPAPAPPTDANQVAWHGVIADLSITLPNAERILHNNLTLTSVQSLPGPDQPAGTHYHVTVTHANTMQRLQRLAELFARRLSAILKQPAQVSFCLAQEERSPP